MQDDNDDLDAPRGILAALGLSGVLLAGTLTLAEVFGFSLFGHADDAQVTASIVAEAQACIQQYGPAERWISSRSSPSCTSPAGSVPAHVLSQPVSQ